MTHLPIHLVNGLANWQHKNPVTVVATGLSFWSGIRESNQADLTLQPLVYNRYDHIMCNSVCKSTQKHSHKEWVEGEFVRPNPSIDKQQSPGKMSTPHQSKSLLLSICTLAALSGSGYCQNCRAYLHNQIANYVLFVCVEIFR